MLAEMREEEKPSDSERRCPVFYERAVPIALAAIAVGAILPASGGTFSRMGLPDLLHISELPGAVLLFPGFIRAMPPMAGEPDAEFSS